MRVYFVRHGQTPSNIEKRHQFPEEPLSDIGLQQAQFLGKRFKNITVDLILTSPYTRAFQTAEEIKKVVNKELTTSDLLIERKTPTIFKGKFRTDPELVEIKKEIKIHRDDPEWHYSDEENFTDFKKRGLEAIKHIESLELDNLVVVTHGYMLSIIALIILFGDTFTAEQYEQFDTHAHATNTGVTLCDYREGKWTLFTWNDAAHLAE